MKKISVIITTYNDSEYIIKSLSSAINQDQKPLEIIIVDDGSKEPHEKTIHETITLLKKEYKNIRAIRQKNAGPSSARNLGIKEATGEYICFLDADDYWKEKRLSRLSSELDKAPDHIAAVYTGATLENSPNKQFEIFIYDVEIDKSRANIVGATNGVACGSPFFLFKKSKLIKIGGFDEKIRWNEDLDLIIRLLGDGNSILGVNDYSFVRCLRQNSYSKENSRETFESIMLFLDKNLKLGNISNDEHARRKKYTALLHLAHSIKKLSPVDISHYSKIAFAESPPKGAKQKALSFASKAILLLTKH